MGRVRARPDVGICLRLLSDVGAGAQIQHQPGSSFWAVNAIQAAVAPIDVPKLTPCEPPLPFGGVVHGTWTVRDERVIGRPSLATAEGKAVLASLVDTFASVLEVLQRT